ncbi:hypothetical protein MMC07_003705 [Pseudocyphellaria aurata]|nr:hypothetical protein [Pseudocyphellaria aurata]
MFTSALKSFTSNISANYTISTTPTSISGAWKVYDGKKKSSGKAVSVFVFERKSLDPQSGGLGSRSGGSSLRRLHDEVISRVKKESNLLARLRHPSILELAEPIEDTRNGGLMFATEPVTASLAGLLQEKDDQERAGGVGGRPSRYVVEEADGQKRRRELEIDELEIQKGLLQIAQGLEFLHESAKLIHGNLTPEAIYVNVKSDWKIAGLSFAGPADTSNVQNSITPISLSEALYHDPRLPHSLQLNLDYTSPDFALDSNISPSADMFSLGLLILALYNSPHTSPLKSNSNLASYKKIMGSSSTTPASSNNFLSSRPLPRELISDVLPRLITRRPGQRMNAREFQQSQFFDNILVSSIRFLDSLPAKSPNEKSQFMRGLPRILEQFPKSVLEKKVLPALLEETKDRELLSLILQNVFKIIKLLPSGKRAFTDRVIPQLRDIFTAAGGKSVSVDRDSAKEAGLIVVLESMELIGENCTGKEFKDDIVPILQLGFESPTHAIVDKSLGCLPTVLAILDFTTIKNELFPVVAAVFSKTSSLGIKIRGLEAFVIFCGGSQADSDDLGDGLDGAVSGANIKKPNSSAILDKYTVQEKVVPLLKAIKTKEPAVMMAALGVFKQVGKIADAEFLAIDVLPTLWNFSLGPLLNLEQFQKFMSLIKTLSLKIEQEQTRKLRELSSNSNGNTSTSKSHDVMGPGLSINVYDSNGADGAGENDFERLVLGKPRGASDDMLGESLRPQPQRATTSRAETSVFSWSTPALTPTLSSNFRAITPDQTLNSFPTLQPKPKTATDNSNQTFGSFNTLTPMQRPSPWSFSGTSDNSIPPPQQFQSQPTLAQPPTSNSTFSTFSIAPPPTHTQRSYTQPNYGGGLGTSQSRNPMLQPASTNQTTQPKRGLDAYESLL